MEDYYLNDFHCRNSEGCKKAIEEQSLHPYFREEVIANQIRDSFKRESELGKTQEVKYTASDLEETHLTINNAIS